MDRFERSKPKARDYLWASQLGGSVLDAWLTLMGEEKSNDFTAREKRKFDAGTFWEWIVFLVAKRAGVFIDGQRWVEFQYPKLLRVGGYYDLRVGGKRNFDLAEKTKQAIELLGLPSRFVEAMEHVASNIVFDAEFPERILEVKSCSGMMFEYQYQYLRPSDTHVLQLFHYLKSTGVKEGAIIYVSKDDSRMTEIPVFLEDASIERAYRLFIKEVTRFYKTNKKPEKEPLIVFNCEKGKFESNWNIKYSAYLTKEYGFETAGAYEEYVSKIVSRWNRVLDRAVKNKKITKDNQRAIEEINQSFSFEKVLKIAKQAPIREGGEEI